ncbi:hypothetical protein [Pimelobacter sp. 30-1]|uniref:hypothetical protein n=1 Tax=Pimelobacter sp. 30-1 TaxID=2004991 RepID=UPI001C04CE97|nr:hypothetical protein [Pimelobacter sp. 30-1]MBU2697720.1 hypothetical protein [Pimelobacter sp. 30-1]
MTSQNDLDATAARLDATLDQLGTVLAELTTAVQEFKTSIAGFDGVVDKADGLLARADKLLAPLAATQQVGDQLKVAGALAGQVASAAVKKGVAAAKGARS